MKTREQIQQEIEFGHVLTLDEFIEYDFVPYDGQGYFHDGEKETGISVWDDSMTWEDVQKFPFVIWYNK